MTRQMGSLNNTLKIKVGGEWFICRSEDLQIDRNDLDSELARQAALYAWYATLHERLRAERMEIEAALEDKEAELLVGLKGQIAEGGAKRSEAQLKAEVKLHPDRRALRTRALKLEHDEKLLLGFVQALAQRKDLLVALARSRNYELSALSPVEIERVKANLMRR